MIRFVHSSPIGFLCFAISFFVAPVALAQSIQITAPVAFLYDVGTKSVLFEKAADDLVAPASLVKLLTAETVFDALAKGDEVATAGGLLGKVTKLGDSYLTLELAAGVEVQLQRSAIVQVLPKGAINTSK